jgi:small subunit ribosomal protein S20
MPRLQQAKKALRQSDKKRALNDTRRRAVKEAVKAVKKAVKVTIADPLMSKTQQALDKAAKRGVIKKGTASRLKSRIAQAAKKAQ